MTLTKVNDEMGLAITIDLRGTFRLLMHCPLRIRMNQWDTHDSVLNIKIGRLRR